MWNNHCHRATAQLQLINTIIIIIIIYLFIYLFIWGYVTYTASYIKCVDKKKQPPFYKNLRTERIRNWIRFRHLSLTGTLYRILIRPVTSQFEQLRNPPAPPRHPQRPLTVFRKKTLWKFFYCLPSHDLKIRTEIRFKFVQDIFINYSTEIDTNARALFGKGLRNRGGGGGGRGGGGGGLSRVCRADMN